MSRRRQFVARQGGGVVTWSRLLMLRARSPLQEHVLLLHLTIVSYSVDQSVPTGDTSVIELWLMNIHVNAAQSALSVTSVPRGKV